MNKFYGLERGAKVDVTVICVGRPPPESWNFTENGFFTNEELTWVPAPESTVQTGYLDIEYA